MSQINSTANKYTEYVEYETITVYANTLVNTSNDIDGQVVESLNSNDEVDLTYLSHIDPNIFTINLEEDNSSNQKKQHESYKNQSVQIQIVSQGDTSGKIIRDPMYKPTVLLEYNQQQDHENVQFQLQQECNDSNDQIHDDNNDIMELTDLLQEYQDNMIQYGKQLVPLLPRVVNHDNMVMRYNWQYNKIIDHQKDNSMDKQLGIENEKNTDSQNVMAHLSSTNSFDSFADHISNHDDIPLGYFLKFSSDNTKNKYSELTDSQENGNSNMLESKETNNQENSKRTRKHTNISPVARPGQIHIRTALDGTFLFYCPECSMSYSDKALFEQHLVVHNIERRFICELCGAGFKQRRYLKPHKLSHSEERPFVCNICCKGFKRKSTLKMHAVIHFSIRAEICQYCGQIFYQHRNSGKLNKNHITKHLKDKHTALQQTTKHVSTFDLQNISIPDTIQNHCCSNLQQEVNVSNNRIYNNNSGSTKLLNLLQGNQGLIHNGKTVIMEQNGTCSNNIALPQLAVMANQDNIIEKRYQQDNNKINDQKNSQIVKQLGIKSKQDSGNQYAFTHTHNINNCNSLANYILNHNDIFLENFLQFSPDNIAGEKSSSIYEDSNSKIIYPVETNSQDKKSRKYKKKSPSAARNRHIRIAIALDGSFLYCCPECDNAFSDNIMLEKHLVYIHKLERTSICHICGAIFKRKSDLNRHKTCHTLEFPYVCGICQKGFKRQSSLKVHSIIHSGKSTKVRV